jgi:hypothetical protein
VKWDAVGHTRLIIQTKKLIDATGLAARGGKVFKLRLRVRLQRAYPCSFLRPHRALPAAAPVLEAEPLSELEAIA